MNPQIWGPKLWFVLHLMSFNYPENPTYLDKRHYSDFFINMQYVIPCSKCKLHYRQHLDTYPIGPHLDNRQQFVKWLIHLHNQVNISLNKPTMTYHQVLKEYQSNLESYESQLQKKQGSSCSILKILRALVMVIISIIIGYLLYKYLKSKKNVIYIGYR